MATSLLHNNPPGKRCNGWTKHHPSSGVPSYLESSLCGNCLILPVWKSALGFDTKCRFGIVYGIQTILRTIAYRAERDTSFISKRLSRRCIGESVSDLCSAALRRAISKSRREDSERWSRGSSPSGNSRGERPRRRRARVSRRRFAAASASISRYARMRPASAVCSVQSSGAAPPSSIAAAIFGSASFRHASQKCAGSIVAA